ncbi:RNA polymerase-associated protein LEO1 [Lachnellula suecica]|uniref:RNA polymerase-associated protein LEO1 n=1 Tax=Lachnellula suecica TaxID=602035 RepID=A0A8T9C3Q7_9HELO|nr:RNA polymerase-associated protein LEO1 [Lachnellula suecica]
MASSEDDVVNSEPELEDDLFGDDDGEGDEPAAPKPRELSDEELDSGDDEGRADRAEKDEGGYKAQYDKEQLRIEEKTLWRHPLPKPLDGEFNTLRLPKFLGIEPRAYVPENFTIPTTDHHSDIPSDNFSANATSASTMRYRKNPATDKLESNTVVYRWSDGSTTLGVGDQHYELQTKPMAPHRDTKPYQEVMDSHSYVASPSVSAQVLVLFGHMTNQYTVRPNKDIQDDALEKLQKSLAAAARGGHKGEEKNGPELITNTQDPELQKKQAEMAEKERMRAQRRRETAAEKASASGRGRIGGLTVDDLEGRSGRRAPAGRKSGGVKRPRRRPDYDSDDDLPRGRGREDEYDKEDDFLADSDEELEDGPEGDDDEEEELPEESDRDEPLKKKQKPSRVEEVSDADADAEADLDDEDAPAPPVASEAPAGRGRKRNVIEDDEDDE